MATKKIEKELELCHYLVSRINKIMPMSNAVESITKIKHYESGIEEDFATITFMNGASVYIAQHRVCNNVFFDTLASMYNKYVIGFSVQKKYKIFNHNNGFYYDFNKENGYKELYIGEFVIEATKILIEDFNKMLDASE